MILHISFDIFIKVSKLEVIKGSIATYQNQVVWGNLELLFSPFGCQIQPLRDQSEIRGFHLECWDSQHWSSSVLHKLNKQIKKNKQ